MFFRSGSISRQLHPTGFAEDRAITEADSTYAIRLNFRYAITSTIMQEITDVISNDRDCFIELSHRTSDPGSWIVRRWKIVWWFRKRVSSNWFLDKQQALAFAAGMKRDHENHRNR